MKFKISIVAITILLITVISFSVVVTIHFIMQRDTGQGVTYTWVGGSSANFTTAASWSPVRINGQQTDILCFNCGGTVNALNAHEQTIGQLLITNNTNLILSPASGNPISLLVKGVTGNDFFVEAGSTFQISGTAPIMGLYIETGATGNVYGSVNLSGSSAHYINAQDPNSLVFHNGSSLTQSTPGAIFTTAGTANAIVFQDGSTFIINSSQASSPFGLTAPNSKVVFSPNSTFILQQPNPAALKLNGRAYGNFTLDCSSSMQDNDTLSSNVVFNNITINAGSSLSLNNLNLSYIPAFIITGNLNVNGSLNFINNHYFIVHFHGANNQIVSGTGTISIPTSFVFSQLYLTNCKIIANTIVAADGSINSNNGYIIGSLTKHFSSIVKIQNFEIGTANGYSPVKITFNNITGSGSDIYYYSLTIIVTSSVHPLVQDSTKAMKRYWSIHNNGLQFDYYAATFQYLPIDFNNTNFTQSNNEASMQVVKYENAYDTSSQNQTINMRDTTNHIIGINIVKNFGDFTNVKNDSSINRMNPNSNQGQGNKNNFNQGQSNKNNINQQQNELNVTKPNVPTKFGISQNYPNPFNPTTKIDYQLPFESKVTIIIYDLNGREVEKLVNSDQNAGNYTIQFNGINLSSGIYFYEINASGGNQNFEKTLKMILIK